MQTVVTQQFRPTLGRLSIGKYQERSHGPCDEENQILNFFPDEKTLTLIKH